MCVCACVGAAATGARAPPPAPPPHGARPASPSPSPSPPPPAPVNLFAADFGCSWHGRRWRERDRGGTKRCRTSPRPSPPDPAAAFRCSAGLELSQKVANKLAPHLQQPYRGWLGRPALPGPRLPPQKPSDPHFCPCFSPSLLLRASGAVSLAAPQMPCCSPQPPAWHPQALGSLAGGAGGHPGAEGLLATRTRRGTPFSKPRLTKGTTNTPTGADALKLAEPWQSCTGS